MILYVESKKVMQMNLFTKQKQTHKHGKQTYDYKRRSGEREEMWSMGLTDTQLYTENR